MIQGNAIRVLSYYRDRDSASFAELCRYAEYPTDLGGYYIRHLVQSGYLFKEKRGTYRVTVKGKKELIDLVADAHRPQPSRIRFIVLFVGKQGNKYICLERHVQPFIDQIEWPGGEVYTGERLNDAIERLLRDRLGGKPQGVKLKGFFRRIDTHKDTMFDDKFFAVYTYTMSANASLPPASSRGKLITLTIEQLVLQKRLSRSLVDILRCADGSSTEYQERFYELNGTDLRMDPSYLSSQNKKAEL